MTAIDSAIDSARKNRKGHLAQLKELLSLPSISTLSEHQPDIQRAADWLANRLRVLGFDSVEIVPTDRHPVVYGEWLKAPGKPTVVVYGHYDVQPVDPLDEWTSEPFQPTIRGEDIFARGAADMKGQIISFLQAVEALMEQGGLPVNLKLLWEGEEEIGSPGLPGFLDQYREKLDCDAGFGLRLTDRASGSSRPRYFVTRQRVLRARSAGSQERSALRCVWGVG